MKTNILISLIAVVAMAMVSSCSSYSSAEYEYFSYSSETQTAEQIGKNGFIIKTVKPGDTLWEYSEKVHGTGYKWAEILRENPHLAGRLSYDKDRKISIVTIYPGETIRVGGKTCHPSFSSALSDNNTTTISSSYKKEAGKSVSWWVWVIPTILIITLAIAFIWLRYATRHARARERERRDKNRLIKEAMISNYGKKVHVSWTENSFEIS